MKKNKCGGFQVKENIGDEFQRATKYYLESLSGKSLDWSKMPEPFKKYRAANTIPLPNPQLETLTLAECLKKRKSVREYAQKPISKEQLSFLLWAQNGMREAKRGFIFRTAPSAGGLYPVETYVQVNDVEGIHPGIYHYDVIGHQMEEIVTGDFRREISYACLEQEMCGEAQAVVAWSAIFARSKWKYRDRAYRYIYLDAGHIAQNLALAAVSIGLATCQIGAFFDDEVNKIFCLDGNEESVIYLSTVGHPP